MTTMQNDGGKGTGHGPSPAGIALVAVALVLAFLVGRFTAPHGFGGPRVPQEPEDSAEAVQKVDALFAKFAEDKKWDENEDREFMDAVGKLSVKGQMRQLSILGGKINSGELILVTSSKAPAQKPGAPAQKPGAPAQKPGAPAQKK
jgi:hypothetical protein